MSGHAGSSDLANPQILLTDVWNHLLVTFVVEGNDSRYYENGVLRDQKWGRDPLNLNADASMPFRQLSSDSDTPEDESTWDV